MKYIVAAFIAIGAMLAVSAQAAPLSPASVQTEQAIATGGSVEKVCWGGGCGYGGWGGPRIPYWWNYCPTCGRPLWPRYPWVHCRITIDCWWPAYQWGGGYGGYGWGGGGGGW